MASKLESNKLLLATILAFVLVLAPLVIGYQASQFAWGLSISVAAFLACMSLLL